MKTSFKLPTFYSLNAGCFTFTHCKMSKKYFSQCCQLIFNDQEFIFLFPNFKFSKSFISMPRYKNLRIDTLVLVIGTTDFNLPFDSFSMPSIGIAIFSTKAMLSIFSTAIDQHCGRSSQKASYCVENETSYYFKVYISCRGDFRLPQKNGRFNFSLLFDACVPTNSMTFKIYRGKISRMGKSCEDCKCCQLKTF